MDPICDDLEAEHAELDRLVSALDERGWDMPTPAEGWTIRDQIAHLAYFDEAGLTAATDPERFRAEVAALAAGGEGSSSGPDPTLARARASSGAQLLTWWRQARSDMVRVFRTLDPRARLPWYGPDMGARSFATARLMETWAHGQDVADALTFERPATDRLRHVAHIGIGARPFAYAINRKELPGAGLRVELQGPSGETWTWGDPDATDRITGPALDFCLLVTQRRHLDDLDLQVEGEAAREWVGIAQSFAGPPGSGRAAGQFPKPS
jgi:uncharacterized protein (TIGR03084 family)